MDTSFDWTRLSSADLTWLRLSVDKGQALENKWARKTDKFYEDLTDQVLANLAETGRIRASEIDFTELLMDHRYDSLKEGLEVAHAGDPTRSRPDQRLAKAPKTLGDLRRQHDKWQQGKIPPNMKKAAADLKKEYLKKIMTTWEDLSEDFRNGTVADQEAVRQKINRRSRVSASRAESMVRTSTTTYYNAARRAVYDASKDVTHYLLLAIRDARTSKWCTDKTTQGKRGRHGLVYAKTDPLLARETPALHPFCRSEILPLTPANPRHLKLIEDKSIARRSHKCWPLIPGWVGPGAVM